ncbi:MAG: serine protease [Bacteroidetes bacterium]|nr:MAG: serine protease [Bacteroidota bacterium]
MKKLILSLILALSLSFSFAGEGMWLPLLLKALNEAEMQSMGMRMTAEDIYSVNQGSLKDAIVHFGGFCTGEIISRSGLVLTNHHCGYGAVQSHSTIENNLLKNGFWAMNKGEELPNPGLFVKFIVRIEDVTEEVLAGVNEDMTSRERQSAVDKNINGLEVEKVDYQDYMVRPFFNGNQYFLFVTETYSDVRLVGAPPESIGKFGADTDNWEWPRHTGDFSLFRIYASPDNTPAEYSADNVPYTPKHSLPISLDGVETGDFTLVFGFPGRTNQYLPSPAVKQIMDVVDPARINIRSKSLKVMDKYMRADEATRLKYAGRFASVANGWKKWIGETQGLEQTDALGKKNELETEFTSRILASDELQSMYGNLLPSFEELYANNTPYIKARIYYDETFNRGIQLFRIVRNLDRLKSTYVNNGEEAYANLAERYLSFFEDYFEDYETIIDREVCEVLLNHFYSNLDKKFLPESIIKEDAFMRDLRVKELTHQLFQDEVATIEGVRALLALDGKGFGEAIDKLYAIAFYRGVQDKLKSDISPSYDANTEGIRELQRIYMKALMEVFPERTFWPDANSTLRVTYGYAEGYEPRDAVTYQPVSFLDGVMQKYKPGDYEFDVHPKLIELYEQGDFGQYADRVTGKMPVCFLGSNHTSGGNSGSPAIDADGNLVGLNFDRVWEGTMSDIHYDRSICRNIMVDIRYVLFVLDKFGGAGYLVEEMELVHPKS